MYARADTNHKKKFFSGFPTLGRVILLMVEAMAWLNRRMYPLIIEKTDPILSPRSNSFLYNSVFARQPERNDISCGRGRVESQFVQFVSRFIKIAFLTGLQSKYRRKHFSTRCMLTFITIQQVAASSWARGKASSRVTFRRLSKW